MLLGKRIVVASWRKSLEFQVRKMSSTAENPIVELPGLGRLRGSVTQSAWSGRKIYQFLGVKYAEAPIGELRFKAPVPVAAWEGVKDATKYGTPAPSYNTILAVPKEKITPDLEDCINLCVYTTDINASKPVMVYIHGGGFFTGSASQHPANYLLEKDVVLVVPQFRLGPLGFLSTMTETIPGNAGVLDVILAFEWVQKYIAHFGGDPKQVTAFAQSAGATLLSILTYSDLARDELFSRAIMSSSASFATWCYDFNCVSNARDIARRSGCSSKASLEEVNDFLMKADAKTLVASFMAHMQAGTPNGINTIGGHRITIGGPSNLLPETTFQLMRKGKGRRNLPLMAGVAKHDATFLISGLCDIYMHTVGYDNHKFNQFELIDSINKILGSDEQTGALAALATMTLFDIEDRKKGDFYAMVDAIFDLSGALVVKAPVIREVQYHISRNKTPTYLYTFDYEGEHTRFGYGEDTSKYPFDGGVAHSDDNIYLFPWPKSVAKLNEEDTKIAQKMVDLWTSFAITGVPTSPQVSNWPAMENLVGPYLHINKECSIGDNFYDELKVISREKRNRKRNQALLLGNK
ncbi:glutactin-like [Phlebotomus papatasi]|uniref:glutactin-like n=1 Tax=Phlebotomus papatasi TaxID=29031 RepID=UPI0024838F7F|nr:glutactin-like [Phlebotomus papatasi]